MSFRGQFNDRLTALNISEGGERKGRDRMHHFRIASGSAAELQTGLGIAAAWGYVPRSALEPMQANLHRLGGLLYGLTRG